MMPSPKPRLPPVTTTLCIVPDQLARMGDFEIGHEAYHGQYLVFRQSAPTELENLPLHIFAALARLRLVVQEHIGDDDRSGEWVLPRSNQRHAHFRVPIDDPLDLLGMHLEPTDIHDAALASQEMIAAVD